MSEGVRIGVSHAWLPRRPPTPNPGTISIPKKILIYILVIQVFDWNPFSPRSEGGGGVRGG